MKRINGVCKVLVYLLLFFCISLAGTARNQAADNSPLSLSAVRYWGYQIQGLDNDGAIAVLANSRYDMVVIDPTVTTSPDFDAAGMVSQIKASKANDGVHRKLVIAYIDIGQAEEWRWYWNGQTTYEEQGECNSSFIPQIQTWAPWVVACDPDGWAGNYPVAFWDPGWQDVVINGTTLGASLNLYFDSMLDEVIQDGFDGIYLDWVEAWEMDAVSTRAQNEGKDPGREMLTFIKRMRTYGRQYNPNFIVIQQNSSELINEVGASELATAVDGIAQEGVWWDGDAIDDNWNDPAGYDQASCCTDYYLSRLQKYRTAGLPVLVCDYAVQNADDVYEKCETYGFIGYATRRPLSFLTTTPPDFQDPASSSISVNNTQLTYSAIVNGGNPSPQTLSISNGGSGTLNWSITDNASWLSVSPNSGTDSGDMAVSVTVSGLSAGTHNGAITITDTNASNSPVTVNVTLNLSQTGQAVISIDKSALIYSGLEDGAAPPSQTFLVDNSGTGTLTWSISDTASWLACTPTSGSGAAEITASVDSSGLSEGTYSGTISISANASNSPQSIAVTFNVLESGGDDAPFGNFDSPVHGSTVSSSVPVSGWALDDIAVDTVKIYRQENSQLVYIGDAQLVEGARPDVAAQYLDYPMNTKAGWGYMMLTNFLPNQGNGTFHLVAIARDGSGNETNLGTKTITCDNANAVKPFGAIDFPGPGGTASGNAYENHGWVLTPLPNSISTDGSTISVYVDGENLGHPLYNLFREDIAALFPGYANSSGAHGYFLLDTIQYENGVHTIAWTAQDSGGNTDGIGSRYFSIQNTGSNRQSQRLGASRFNVPANSTQAPLSIRLGYDPKAPVQKIHADAKGVFTICLKQSQRLEILTPEDSPFKNRFRNGCLRGRNAFKRLPIGSTPDIAKGAFYWQPGPAFLGEFPLFFYGEGADGKTYTTDILIKVMK
ncbi:MAG: hypothetical protein GY765_27060 [bacterium]|nr:hypothetical protein [bacterium]